MTVPEAAVYENGGPPFRKDKIWLAWKSGNLQPKAQPKPVGSFANQDLWFGIATLD